MAIATVHDRARTSNRSARRRTLRMRAVASFRRLRSQFGEWKRDHFPPVEREDWSLGDFEGMKSVPSQQPRALGPGPSSLPNDPAGHGHTERFQVPAQQQPRPQRPPLALPARSSAHTLAWMMHRLTDLLADPNLTAVKALEALRDPNRELNELFLEEQKRAEEAQAAAETLARRTARNAQVAAGAAHGLQVALQTPGVNVETAAAGGGEFVPALAAQMVSAAVRASDTTLQTGVLPKITADMVDPRLQPLKPEEPGSVVTADVVDQESVPSPVHDDNTGTQPAIPPQRVTPDHPFEETGDTAEPVVSAASESDAAEDEREQVAS